MNDKMVTALILDHAGQLIKRHGWMRFIAGDYQHGFCAVGAIGTACHEMSVGSRHFEASFDIFEEFLGTDIMKWNDKQRRTKGEVIEALQTCAEKLRIEVS